MRKSIPVIAVAAGVLAAGCSPVERPKLRRDVAIPVTSQPPPAPSVAERLPQSSAPTTPLPAPAAVVTPELSNAVADATVTVEVKTALGRDRELRGVDLDTVNGIVVLRGEVTTVQARERAVWLAAHVNGVRSVHDDLRVERTYLR